MQEVSGSIPDSGLSFASAPSAVDGGGFGLRREYCFAWLACSNGSW